MYGDQYHRSIQSTNQLQYTNQYSNSKDDYSIENGGNAGGRNECKGQQYSQIKEESISTSYNEIGHQAANVQLSKTVDQWPMNYYDQTAYSLQEGEHCNQSNIPQTIVNNLHSGNLQSSTINAIQPTSVQSNVQLNIQLNVQNNINSIIASNETSNLQANIQQTINQFTEQVTGQHTNNQFTNQLTTDRIHDSGSVNKTFSNTFNDYSSNDSILPSTKKIKTEKLNFNSNYHSPQSHNSLPSDYFHHHHSVMIKNQVRQSNNFNQCDLSPYTCRQQSSNNFNLSSTDLSSSTSGDYYSEHGSITNSIIQPYQQHSIKSSSDQLDYVQLNSNLINQQSNQPDEKCNEMKKLMENNSTTKQSTCLSNLSIQSTHSINQSTNSTTNDRINFSNNHQSSYSPQSTNHQQPKTSLNRPMLGKQVQAFYPMRTSQNSSTNVKRGLKAKLIQTQLQNQFSHAGRLSNSVIKLVDKKEVPNCKLINNNKSINQNRIRSTGVYLDEDDKKRRRRERNKLAATKCRNKKKAHVLTLNEQNTTLDNQNRHYHNEIAVLKREEQRLIQLLIDHRTICDLRFTAIDLHSEQFYSTNSQFSDYAGGSGSNDFVSNNFNQSMLPNENQSLKNINRIKMEQSNYDLRSNNQITNLNHHFNNNQQIIYNHTTIGQPNPIIKIEDYCYSMNKLPNLSNNYQPSDYDTQSYNSLSSNYDQYNHDSTNYGQTILNANPLSNSSNLINLDYTCTNDETLNMNTDNNDVFLTSC